jgi:hypothetical protein
MTRIINLAAIAVAVSLGVQAATWDDAWRHCDAAAECVVLKDACDGWTSVNAKHKGQAEAYFDFERPRVECSMTLRPTPQPPARCEDNQCVIG